MVYLRLSSSWQSKLQEASEPAPVRSPELLVVGGVGLALVPCKARKIDNGRWCNKMTERMLWLDEWTNDRVKNKTPFQPKMSQQWKHPESSHSTVACVVLDANGVLLVDYKKVTLSQGPTVLISWDSYRGKSISLSVRSWPEQCSSTRTTLPAHRSTALMAAF